VTATLPDVVVPHVADRVGQVLGGRYRLVAPLGSGASATVYLGDDVTLRRRVAVKVLHPALADDEAFLRRFRAEAQVAAALNHPNVLAVHDWGQDGSTPYLVSEFLAGGSLRSMLDGAGPLTASQVLVVGLEASRGLAYAHRRGLVHRDIKPANLLFDDEARLRIADFGLARALAEAAWTEPMGAVLGTARYASPEQARGQSLDGRSDVYSLALVLVEAATGTVPFSTDTTIGTLMARVDAPLPIPDGLGLLGEVLAAAGSPEPSDRPDADALSAALFDVARQMDRPGPLPLAGSPVTVADHDTDVGATAAPVGSGDGDVTVIADTGVAAETPASASTANGLVDDVAGGAAVGAVEGAVGGAAVGAVEGAEGVGPDETAQGAAAAQGTVEGQGAVEAQGAAAAPAQATPERSRRRRWPWLVALLAVAAIAGGSLFWWTSVRVVSSEVPVLVGVAVTAAEQAARDGGWELSRSEAFDPVLAAGLVVSQSPEAGVSLARGEVLTVVVSAGPAPVPVPDGLVGVPLADAEQALVGVGLALGSVTEAFDEVVPAGVVLTASTEPGVELPFGEVVDLVVSAGPEPRTVPDNLVGRALDEVRNLLEALGLPVSVGGESYSDSVPAGGVIEAAPSPGQTVDRGTPVLVEVSLGPPVVAIPDVIGLPVVEAARRLEAAGLVVTATTGSPTQPVTSTDPARGTTVRLGSNITISTR
jgi:beta-lactam-binding protein with PASTA domain/tRNA A-37 threonylcarbamoyl transferase component Bud32